MMRFGSLDGVGNPFRGMPSLDGVGNPAFGLPSLEGVDNPAHGLPSLDGVENPFRGLPSFENSDNPFSDSEERRTTDRVSAVAQQFFSMIPPPQVSKPISKEPSAFQVALNSILDSYRAELLKRALKIK